MIANAPRIKGRVGQADATSHVNGKSCAGKWFFEISIWTLDGETQAGEPLQYGPFETEDIAHQEMKNAIRICCDIAEKHAGQEPSGKYFDLKAGGVMRPWDEQ